MNSINFHIYFCRTRGIFKVATPATNDSNHLPRSAIVRLTTSGKNAVSLTRIIQVTQTQSSGGKITRSIN